MSKEIERVRKQAKRVQFKMTRSEWIHEIDEIFKLAMQRVFLQYESNMEDSVKREEQTYKDLPEKYLKKAVRFMFDIPEFLSIEELKAWCEIRRLENMSGTSTPHKMQPNQNLVFDEREITLEQYFKFRYAFQREMYEENKDSTINTMKEMRRGILEPAIKAARKKLELKLGVIEENMKRTLLFKILNGEFKNKKIERKLSKTNDTIMIGRSEEECFKKGLSLPYDDEISSNHAVIKVSADENGEAILLFRDCGSMNGSRINGKTVQQHENIEIFENDEIGIGNTLLKLSVKQ